MKTYRNDKIGEDSHKEMRADSDEKHRITHRDRIRTHFYRGGQL